MTTWEYALWSMPLISDIGIARRAFDPATGMPVDAVADTETAAEIAERLRAELGAELADRGASGWELAASHLIPNPLNEVAPGALLFIFKRPRPD